MARSPRKGDDTRASQKQRSEPVETPTHEPASEVEASLLRGAGQAVQHMRDAAATSVVAQGDAEYDVADLGEGFQEASADEFITPYLVLLQAKSKPTVKQKAEYVPGAEPGMLMDSVSRKLYRDGAVIIPLHREEYEIEWVPRGEGGGGGGLVAKHDPRDPEIAAARKAHGVGKIEGFGDGNELVQTYYLYALILDPETEMWNPIVIPFASSNISAYKRLMSLARSQKVMVPNGQGGYTAQPLPLYAHAYKLTTAYTEKNGNDWFKLNVDFAANGNAEQSRIGNKQSQYHEAKEMRRLITSGKVRTADDTLEQADDAAAVGMADESSPM